MDAQRDAACPLSPSMVLLPYKTRCAPRPLCCTTRPFPSPPPLCPLVATDIILRVRSLLIPIRSCYLYSDAVWLTPFRAWPQGLRDGPNRGVAVLCRPLVFVAPPLNASGTL